MGTIVERKNKSGIQYRAQVIKKRGGKVDLSVSSTFARKTSAKAWIKRIEKDYDAGALKNESSQVTVFGLVDRCVTIHRKTMGKTKRQVLNTIQKFPIAELEVSSLRTSDLVEFAEQVADGLHGEAPRSPATAANYLSHLSGCLRLARPVFDIPFEKSVLTETREVVNSLGIVGKSKRGQGDLHWKN